MQEYFDSTVKKVLDQIGGTLQIEIKTIDHDTLEGIRIKALAICTKNKNGYEITIDEYFVQVCYIVMNNKISTERLNPISLEEVIHRCIHSLKWLSKDRDFDRIMISYGWSLLGDNKCRKIMSKKIIF